IEFFLRHVSLRLSTNGADDRDRTGDLVLTKDVLCQLSYIGLSRADTVGFAASRTTTRPCLVARPAANFTLYSVRGHLTSHPSAARVPEGKAGAGDGDRTRDQQLGRL